MRLYLYTENFESNRFDLSLSENGEDPQPVSAKDEDNIISKMSELECKRQVDDHGIAVETRDASRRCIAFKILLQQKSPEGRNRLAFGCAEADGSFSETDISNIIRAVVFFFGDMAISVPDGRLTDLRKSLLEASIRRTSNKANRALLYAGVTLLLLWMLYRLLLKF